MVCLVAWRIDVFPGADGFGDRWRLQFWGESARIAGDWQAEYAGRALEYLDADGAILHSAGIGSEGVSPFTVSSPALEFEFDCTQEGSICPAQVLGDVFAVVDEPAGSSTGVPGFTCAEGREMACEDVYDPGFDCDEFVCDRLEPAAPQIVNISAEDGERLFLSTGPGIPRVNARSCTPISYGLEATIERSDDGTAVRIDGVVTAGYSPLCFLVGEPSSADLEALRTQTIRVTRDFTATRTGV